jgi:hypothetical protein
LFRGREDAGFLQKNKKTNLIYLVPVITSVNVYKNNTSIRACEKYN